MRNVSHLLTSHLAKHFNDREWSDEAWRTSKPIWFWQVLVIDSSPPAGLSQLAGSDTSYGCWNSTPPPSISPSLHPQIPTGHYPAGLAKATAWPKEVQTTISIPPLSCLNLMGKTSSGGFDGRLILLNEIHAVKVGDPVIIQYYYSLSCSGFGGNFNVISHFRPIHVKLQPETS